MNIEALIRTARLRAVFDRIPVTLAITVVNGAAVAAVLAAGGASAAVWVWFAAVLVLAAARLASRVAFQRGLQPRGIVTWERVAVGGALASGALWGVGAMLLPAGNIFAAADPAGAVAQIVLVLLLGFMCAGAATVHAVHLPTALAFILPAGVPLALRLAIHADGLHVVSAVVMLLFVAVLCAVARRSARQFGAALRLEIALAQRTEELDRANAALRAEIDEHRATGETLRQAQRMEAIGQLTGGVAHDFNNVLAVIGGNLQLIARHGEANPNIRRLVVAAERAAERGARLTASLLSFAREQQLRPEEVDLNLLVREFAPLLRRTLGGRMELALDLAPGVLSAMADAAHFQAALMHLVINARDASPPGRCLTISTELVDRGDDVGAGPDGIVHRGPFVCIRVTDTGPGMAPDVAARAFEPFYTTKEVGKGSGLGLAQVYGFARQSGGTARIEGAAGGGTVVSILLPAPAQPTLQEPEAAAPAPVPAGPSAGRVLLVEDDAGVREVLQESLAASGWDVVAMPDGTAARTVLEGAAPIDIVVSDVVMPGEVSGVELARTAARLRPGLPVLLISGYPTATLSAHGANEGELDLLRKPFTHAELIGRMQAARQRSGRRMSDARERAAGD